MSKGIVSLVRRLSLWTVEYEFLSSPACQTHLRRVRQRLGAIFETQGLYDLTHVIFERQDLSLALRQRGNLVRARITRRGVDWRENSARIFSAKPDENGGKPYSSPRNASIKSSLPMLLSRYPCAPLLTTSNKS